MNQLSALNNVTLKLLEQVSTATLTTQLYRRGFRNVSMQGVAPIDRIATGHLVGPAFTLRNIPAREDLATLETLGDPEFPQRKAIETVPAGYVLVQDCRGEKNGASIGSILATRLKVRGVAGLVSDGPVRDSGVIAALDFPVYCNGASAPLNLVKHHPADINLPIGCGGVAVFPGDIIVGDVDGVVVVPRHLADQVAADAAEQEHLEDFIITLIQDGAPLRGTYPPNDTTKAAYEAWKQKEKQ
jgi:regulator of RNase E activity RraA